MKNYEEMAHDALKRIHEYDAEKRRKRKIATRTAAAVCPALIVTAAGIGAWKSGIDTPPENQFIVENIAESTTKDDTSSTDTTKADKGTNLTSKITDSKNNDSTVVSEKTSAVTDSLNKDIESGTISDNTNDSVTHKEDEPIITVPDRETDAKPDLNENPPIVKPPTDNLTNGICMFGSSLEYNGETYYDNTTAKISAYTQDHYIGKVNEFNGEYKDDGHYLINSNDSVYTVKETKDVLFVVKDNGAIVIISTRNWSIEKYEPERLEPGYIDPDDQLYEDVSEYISGIIY